MKTKQKTEKIEALTVSQYAKKNGHSLSPVRRAIADGFLIVDRTQKPMRIVGGEMPLTVQRWRQRLEPSVQKLKPSLFGWADQPARLDVLCGSEVKSFPYSEDWRQVPKVIDMIERIADAQRGQVSERSSP